jgi:GAF domain-containing protein
VSAYEGPHGESDREPDEGPHGGPSGGPDGEWVHWLEEVLADAPREPDALTDAARLGAVAALGADDVDRVQPLVGDLLAGAAREIGAPVSLANVVLSGVQVIAGEHGLTGWMAQARATPAEWSLCATVVRRAGEYVVPDMAADEATAQNPLHVVDGFRSYAGVPLTAPDGQVVGSVCVLDTEPREYSEADLDVLRRAAAEAARRMAGAPGSTPGAAAPGA